MARYQTPSSRIPIDEYDGDNLDAQNLLCELVDIESVTGREHEIMSLLENMLGELAPRTERYDMGGGRYNLLASKGNGRPILCLNAHSDTMPPSGSSLARSELDGRVVRGLGSCDDKASIASMMSAFDGVPEEELEGRLDLLISVDEEVSSRGVRTCVEKGYRCDFAIVGEPTYLAPVVAHSGLMFLDLSTNGVGGHGSIPWKGRNAILEMVDLCRNIEELVRDFPSHPMVGMPSTNLGVISGGDATNRIPVRCEARLDVRVMPGMTVDDALGRIERIIGGRGSQVKVFKRGDPFEIRENSVLLKTVGEVQEAIMGSRIESIGMRGWTEADPLRNLAGADSLVLGPGDIGRAHTENELVSLDQVEKAVEIYRGVALEILGRGS